MHDQVQLPDVEVIVHAAGFDVAVFAFFRREDMFQGFDVVAGITQHTEVGAVRVALQECIKALSTHSWHTIHDICLSADQEGDGAPF